MTKWDLAQKLYEVCCTHNEVRSIWDHALQEQTLPEAGRRKKRWQAQALEEVQVSPLNIDLGLDKPVGLGNYF